MRTNRPKSRHKKAKFDHFPILRGLSDGIKMVTQKTHRFSPQKGGVFGGKLTQSDPRRNATFWPEKTAKMAVETGPIGEQTWPQNARQMALKMACFLGAKTEPQTSPKQVKPMARQGCAGCHGDAAQLAYNRHLFSNLDQMAPQLEHT